MHLPVFRTSTHILVRLNIDSPSHAPFCLTIKSLHTRLFKIKSTSLYWPLATQWEELILHGAAEQLDGLQLFAMVATNVEN